MKQLFVLSIFTTLATTFIFNANALSANNDKLTLLRTLDCKANLAEYNDEDSVTKILDSDKEISFKIKDFKNEFYLNSNDTKPWVEYYSSTTLNSPVNSQQKLYGMYSTDGGEKDMQHYRDAKPNSNWGGISWYNLSPNQEDAGNKTKDIARMFLKSKKLQINQSQRHYSMVIRFAEADDKSTSGEKNVRLFQALDLTCNVK